MSIIAIFTLCLKICYLYSKLPCSLIYLNMEFIDLYPFDSCSRYLLIAGFDTPS